jgi:dipeptidyl aminopeptidase/acylaminoacyl peptidase
VQLSPDGRAVSYMLQRADWKANRLLPHIWRQTIGGGAPVQLTSGEVGEANARWSPDSRTLLYVAAAQNGAQIFIVPAHGGASRQLTRHATSISAPAWAPDGSAIYFIAADAPSDADRERDRLRDGIFSYDENFTQRHLWRITVATGVEQKLTEGDYSVTSFRISRDGTRIVHQRGPTPLSGDDYRHELWLMDADGKNARGLTSNSVEEKEPELSPDNTRVLFVAEANDALEPLYNSHLFVMPASGGPPQPVPRGFRYAIDHAAWNADGTAILAVVNMGAQSDLFRIDARTGAARQLTDGQHSVQFWSLVASADRMVFQLDEPSRIGDAWTLPLDGGTPSRVTGIYDSLATEHALPRQEKVSWQGRDGVTIEGILFYPIGYTAGRRFPLIVQLHGGPSESDKFGYGPGVIVNYVPVLAAKGYAVLRPNYRGSTGYGDTFLRDVVGNYFTNMHLDVLAGVDALVARGIADPDRLGVMGWSAGGHLTNKLITVTDRFKAASSAAGAANWTSMFAQTDARADRVVWFGGTPWQKDAPIDRLWNNSPIKDAARVRTPTLLVAGQDDARVPLPQAIEMFRALKANGVPTKLFIAPREPHQWGGLRHQLFKANVELEWFEHYVNGRGYEWARAPGDSAEARFPELIR